MAYFPLFINISGRKCVVAGGGSVALRKVRTLVLYGADVYVTAREIHPEIRKLLAEDHLILGDAAEDFCHDAVLVVAATSDRETNHRIAGYCRQMKIPVNVTDCPEECTFIFPAVVRRDEIGIGINSGTDTPALTARLRGRISEAVPEIFGQVGKQMGSFRDRIKREVADEKARRRILLAAADLAFEEQRVLTEKELDEIIRQEMT